MLFVCGVLLCVVCVVEFVNVWGCLVVCCLVWSVCCCRVLRCVVVWFVLFSVVVFSFCVVFCVYVFVLL